MKVLSVALAAVCVLGVFENSAARADDLKLLDLEPLQQPAEAEYVHEFFYVPMNPVHLFTNDPAVLKELELRDKYVKTMIKKATTVVARKAIGDPSVTKGEYAEALRVLRVMPKFKMSAKAEQIQRKIDGYFNEHRKFYGERNPVEETDSGFKRLKPGSIDVESKNPEPTLVERMQQYGELLR